MLRCWSGELSETRRSLLNGPDAGGLREGDNQGRIRQSALLYTGFKYQNTLIPSEVAPS